MAVLPWLFLLVLILVCAVNTPFWDEWELVPIFQHLHAGHFLWTDFWWQHNEHRIFFPTLLLVGLAQIDHWNIIAECLASLLTATLSFWLVARTLRQTGAKTWPLLPILSLIWFSPVQVENWLWGWQVEWFMNVLGVAVVAYALSRIRASTLSPRGLLFILGGSILAQFSLGNGMLIWPLAIIALLTLKVNVKQ